MIYAKLISKYLNRRSGLDEIFRGLISQRPMKISPILATSLLKIVANFDLGATTIQRGRDVGLPDYNDALFTLGLKPKEFIKDISSVNYIQKIISEIYDSVNDIDVFVAGLSEDPVIGGVVGPLFKESIKEQFTRLRDGDRFYFRNGGADNGNGGPTSSSYTSEEIIKIEQTTLKDIVERNTAVKFSSSNAFSVNFLDTSPCLTSNLSIVNKVQQSSSSGSSGEINNEHLSNFGYFSLHGTVMIISFGIMYPL
ncbi:hypothetical protein HK096_000430, partial [Nowakowskiella sp. JEL0078]